MLDEKLIEFKRKLENRTEQEREEQKKQLEEHFARLRQEYNKLQEEKMMNLLKIGIKLYEKYDVDWYGIVQNALLSGITIDKLIELFNTYEDEKIKSMFDLEEFIEFMINYHYLKYNTSIDLD